jgi:hypothetical protein
MNIQAKTNEELRTKLSNLLQEKIFMVQIEKACSRISCCKWKTSIQNKEEKCSRINHRQQRTLSFQNKEKRKPAAELVVATELAFKMKKRENRAAELAVANTELTSK